MSETSATIIKLLSALTSPKAAIKYIFVGIFIILSWRFFSKIASDFGTPEGNLNIVVLLLGVGFGSIVAQIIIWIGEQLIDFITKKINKSKKTQEKEKETTNIVAQYKRAFQHLNWKQKEILRELTFRDKVIDFSESIYETLNKNKYIFAYSQITKNEFLSQLNPALVEFTKQHWSEEINNHINDFFYDAKKEKMQVLELLETNHNSESIIDFDICSIIQTGEYNCIYRQVVKEDGFYLSFKNNYLSQFEQLTGKEYKDEVWIDRKRITFKNKDEKKA